MSLAGANNIWPAKADLFLLDRLLENLNDASSRFAVCSRASRRRQIGSGGLGRGKAHRGPKERSISNGDSRTLSADTGSPGDKDVDDGSPSPVSVSWLGSNLQKM